jgi:hypothetical protein
VRKFRRAYYNMCAINILVITATVNLPADVHFKFVKVCLSECRKSGHTGSRTIVFYWLHRGENDRYKSWSSLIKVFPPLRPIVPVERSRPLGSAKRLFCLKEHFRNRVSGKERTGAQKTAANNTS